MGNRWETFKDAFGAGVDQAIDIFKDRDLSMGRIAEAAEQVRDQVADRQQQTVPTDRRK